MICTKCCKDGAKLYTVLISVEMLEETDNGIGDAFHSAVYQDEEVILCDTCVIEYINNYGGEQLERVKSAAECKEDDDENE